MSAVERAPGRDGVGGQCNWPVEHEVGESFSLIGGPTALRARIQAELGAAGPPVPARRTSGAAFSGACTGGTAQAGGSPLAAPRAVGREARPPGGTPLAASRGGVGLQSMLVVPFKNNLLSDEYLFRLRREFFEVNH